MGAGVGRAARRALYLLFHFVVNLKLLQRISFFLLKQRPLDLPFRARREATPSGPPGRLGRPFQVPHRKATPPKKR